jgi:hypothetical protein
VNADAKAKLAERRKRQQARSDWDVINAVRQILGLDPIAENHGTRGKRTESSEEDSL